MQYFRLKKRGKGLAMIVEGQGFIFAKLKEKENEHNSAGRVRKNGCASGALLPWVGPDPGHPSPSLRRIGPGGFAGNLDPDARGHPKQFANDKGRQGRGGVVNDEKIEGGENRGKFLARALQELLEEHPRTQEDRDDIARKVYGCERHEANTKADKMRRSTTPRNDVAAWGGCSYVTFMVPINVSATSMHDSKSRPTIV